MRQPTLVEIAGKKYRLAVNREILGNEKRLVFNIEHYIGVNKHEVVGRLDPKTQKVEVVDALHYEATRFFAKCDLTEPWNGNPVGAWYIFLEKMIHHCAFRVKHLRIRARWVRDWLRSIYQNNEDESEWTERSSQSVRKLQREVWQSERRLLLEEAKRASFKLMLKEAGDQIYPWSTNIPQWIFKQTETYRRTGGLQSKED